MRFYKDKSNPLIEVPIYELVDGRVYVSEDGRRAQYNESKQELVVIQTTELNRGEYMKDLTPKQLNLYWTLMNNKNNR